MILYVILKDVIVKKNLVGSIVDLKKRIVEEEKMRGGYIVYVE